MGSDSIGFALFRFSITALEPRLYLTPQFLLDALLEPVISQHPGFVGRLSYFGKTVLWYALFKELAVRGLSPIVDFTQTPVFKMRACQLIRPSLRVVMVT